jgi:hypothetical protein
MAKNLLTIALVIVVTVSQAKGPAEKGDKTPQIQKPAPLAFIENKGQVMDQNRQARPDIQFGINAHQD